MLMQVGRGCLRGSHMKCAHAWVPFDEGCMTWVQVMGVRGACMRYTHTVVMPASGG